MKNKKLSFFLLQQSTIIPEWGESISSYSEGKNRNITAYINDAFVTIVKEGKNGDMLTALIPTPNIVVAALAKDENEDDKN